MAQMYISIAVYVICQPTNIHTSVLINRVLVIFCLYMKRLFMLILTCYPIKLFTFFAVIYILFEFST